MRTLTKSERKALKLLARGGVRYGTMFCEMVELKAKGIVYSHDNGADKKVGRWTWRPTPYGRQVIATLEAQ